MVWNLFCMFLCLYLPYRFVRSWKRGRVKEVTDQFTADLRARVNRAEQRFNAASPEDKIKHLQRQKAMAGVTAFFSGLIGFAISPSVGFGRTWYSGKEAESICEDIDHEINEIRGKATRS